MAEIVRTIDFNEIFPTMSASGYVGVETQGKRKKMAKGTYTLKVKDGSYGYDAKTGKYGAMDLNQTSSDFAEALRDFLDQVESAREDAEYGENVGDVVLTFSIKPKKGKK